MDAVLRVLGHPGTGIRMASWTCGSRFELDQAPVLPSLQHILARQVPCAITWVKPWTACARATYARWTGKHRLSPGGRLYDPVRRENRLEGRIAQLTCSRNKLDPDTAYLLRESLGSSGMHPGWAGHAALLIEEVAQLSSEVATASYEIVASMIERHWEALRHTAVAESKVALVRSRRDSTTRSVSSSVEPSGRTRSRSTSRSTTIAATCHAQANRRPESRCLYEIMFITERTSRRASLVERRNGPPCGRTLENGHQARERSRK